MNVATMDGPANDADAFVTEARGRRTLDVRVQGATCGGCLSKIERAVGQLPGVDVARMNLSTGGLRVEWTGNLQSKVIIATLDKLGYGATAFEAGRTIDPTARTERRMLIALAVAGFAAGNVMLLSVSVWAGEDMSVETRTLLHWISALIAIPAAAYAGRPFFESALTSIGRRRLNMDVPISLAVILAVVLSLYNTVIGAEHAYFDASVMLLFFLLIGRVLDARLRRRAYAAAHAFASLQTASVTRLDAAGAFGTARASDVRPGDILLLAVGERLAVDSEIVSGTSEVDLRMVSGEVDPVPTFTGQVLHAGSVNLSAALHVRAIAPASESLMADISRMLEAGEQKKSVYRRIADKAAEEYVPRVHALAAIGFIGWLIAGAGLSHATYVAVTVLIITCPCAMALAAPLVQVVAASRLFAKGAYLASGDALERIAVVNHVVFDKTGTLTLGDPVLIRNGYDIEQLKVAAQLARASRHPFSRAIVRAAGAGRVADDVQEFPGEGVVGRVDGRLTRLGTPAFVGAPLEACAGVCLGVEGEAPVVFRFEDRLRPDAVSTIARLRALGLEVELLSGDSAPRVARAAAAAGITRWTAGATPQSKAAHLDELEQAGCKVLMVGDGLNDAGAIAKAHASLAPGGAVDVTRLAADCVFSGDSLGAIAMIVETARTARRRMRENFGFAAIYNVLAAPVALAGLATPLVAAIAMSASSIIVTLNALRMARKRSATKAEDRFVLPPTPTLERTA